MRSSELLGVVTLSALVVVASPFPAFSQSTVVTACANTATGVLRLVFAGSTCKANESPVTWNTTGPQGPQGPAGAQGPAGPAGPQGPAGDDSVIAIGASGLNSTQTVTVTDLGDVTVACSAAGAATAGFTTTSAYQYREDLTTFNGQTQSAFGASSTGKSYTPPTFGNLVTLLIHKPGVGMWRVEFNSRPLLLAAPPSLPLECASAAVITIMK